MGKISEIVNVSITRESMNVTQAGFGTALILVESTALGNRVEAFSDTSELLTNDRFGTGNIAYLAAAALMGQDKKPEQFKVGCKGTTNRNCRQRMVFDAAATAGTFTITYNGETTALIAWDALAATIEAAIEALADITSVTVTQIVASQEWTIEFDGADATTMFELMTVDVSGLTGPTAGTIEFGHQAAWAAPLGGAETVTFTVTVDGVPRITSALAVATWSATSIQTAIQGLSNVGTGNCTVEEVTADQIYIIRFKDDLYGKTCSVTSAASVGGAATMTEWYQGQASETWAQAYTACKTEDEDWYALATPDLYLNADYTDQLALAALIEAEDYKLYSIKTGDATIIASDYNGTAPDDIAESLKANDYDKSFVTYQKSTKGLTEFPDCAILGRQLTRTPGSSTYKFKTLSGVTAESLTTTQKNYLANKNCNYNETIGGVKIYREGVVGSGEFIDVIVGIDYLSVRMGELVYAKLAASEKVPYTTSGIAVIESLVRTALKLYGVDPGIIEASTIIVTVPNIADVSAVDKAARILRNVKFTAQLQGAIHKLYIEGKVYA